jgi:hypothetical protein
LKEASILKQAQSDVVKTPAILKTADFWTFAWAKKLCL